MLFSRLSLYWYLLPALFSLYPMLILSSRLRGTIMPYIMSTEFLNWTWNGIFLLVIVVWLSLCTIYSLFSVFLLYFCLCILMLGFLIKNCCIICLHTLILAAFAAVQFVPGPSDLPFITVVTSLLVLLAPYDKTHLVGIMFNLPACFPMFGNSYLYLSACLSLWPPLETHCYFSDGPPIFSY